MGYGALEEDGKLSSWMYEFSNSEGFHEVPDPDTKPGKCIEIGKTGKKTETANGTKFGIRSDR